ncbi:DNA methyltransferase [Paracoccus zhejiangensis]|uniref:site-specific DNA-methyltransferase (adenine-specific) n=1 Tax=Paracoccus zhejiangensis TaxID=1077935 RepID=A0A2H5EXQ3_9RHOB|nr:DNA methyltransferase [Paracoccus zhejiangensis]AUH64070.1 DNA methylase [Paracoccus zhejiangensis]
MNDLLHTKNAAGSVECLGVTFPSEDARREHFLGLLAEKLKDPAFRNQEGFPQGSDEAILAMSDPPYYTACPNPWLADFVEHYGKPYDPGHEYSREPLAIDVSVGKSDQVYQAHAYHTKVPHLAIVPSILHFTDPGDTVLDGFSGSGMTAIAAQWCDAAPLAYRHQIELERHKAGLPAPRWGARRAIVGDLAPVATFISANQTIPFDVPGFEVEFEKLLEATSQKIGWMYETLHSDGKTKGRIEYTIWSEVFTCPECSAEINFVAEAMDQETKKVRDSFSCPSCNAELTKKRLDRLYTNQFDAAIGENVKTPKREPALIRYTVGGEKYEKKPDNSDLKIIQRIAEIDIPSSVPKSLIPPMHMTHERARMDYSGITHIHHFFLPRAAHALGTMWDLADSNVDERMKRVLLYVVEQAIWTMSVLNRFQPQGFKQVNKYLPGVYYVPSHTCEVSPWYAIGARGKRLARTFSKFEPVPGTSIISTGSATQIDIPDDSVDYIFTDPPFGENIYYADLNYLIEVWHGVTTDATPEAIIDRFKKKALPDYQHLMQRCFAEYHRVLKPGRWMTVVFSNSKAAVWNAIQVALQQAGFVVAEVTALDKVLGSYRQVTSTTAVKQDLVISVYKPNGGLETRLEERGAAPESAWDFVETHLRQLPVSKVNSGILEIVVERDPRRIYDRMVAWFVRHDFPVPLSTEEFLDGLRNRYPERDGMVFLPEQVADYDRKRAQAAQAPQIELFVSDERSAIDWLTDFLRKRPSTYQDVHPEFTVQMGAGWRKHEEKPELATLLEDNFLQYDGKGEVPNQIHSYLSTNFKDFRGLEKDDPRLKAKGKDRWYVPDPSKAKDLEQKRERSLLKEFESYKSAPGRRLKEFRLEVLRAGFKTAWAARDYKTIIGIAQKIPEEALQEDEKLLLWYDQALTRMEANA